MGLKKKSKVSPNFNMSSLTDIIFLLLIFFMLTSSLVTPNALNLQLPGRKSTTPQSKIKPATVDIRYDGSYYLNNKPITLETLESQLVSYQQRMGKDAVVSVTPDGKSSNENVVAVLDILYRYEIKCSLMDPQ